MKQEVFHGIEVFFMAFLMAFLVGISMASGLMVIRITRGGDIFALQLQPQEIAIAW